MERIICVLRNICLIALMIFTYVVLWSVFSGSEDAQLLAYLIISAVAVLAIELITVLYKKLRAGKCETEKQQKFVMMFYVNNLFDLTVINFLRRLGLLGILATILWVVLHKGIPEMTATVLNTFLYGSIISFPFIAILSVIRQLNVLPRLGENTYSGGQIIGKSIVQDIICWWTGIKKVFTEEKKLKHIIHCILVAAFTAVLVLSIIYA